MILTFKQKAIVVVVYTASIAAITIYVSPTKVKIETKTVEVVKTVEVAKTDTDTQKHTKKKTTERTLPTGEKVVTTIEVDDTNTAHKTDTTVATDDSKMTDKTKEVTRSTDKVNLSVLASINPFNVSQGITYGGSVTKQILGPFTLGAFGFTSGQFGMSVGLNL